MLDAFPYLIKLVKFSLFGIAMGLSSFCAVELNLFSPMVRTSGGVSIRFFFTQGWMSPHTPQRKPMSQSKDSCMKNDSKASGILVLFLQVNNDVIDHEVNKDHDVIDDNDDHDVIDDNDDPDINDNDDPNMNDNDDDQNVINNNDHHDVIDDNDDQNVINNDDHDVFGR